ncbi:hypothetical protein Tco_0574268 [Tanacetum coccineum]
MLKPDDAMVDVILDGLLQKEFNEHERMKDDKGKGIEKDDKGKLTGIECMDNLGKRIQNLSSDEDYTTNEDSSSETTRLFSKVKQGQAPNFKKLKQGQAPKVFQLKKLPVPNILQLVQGPKKLTYFSFGRHLDELHVTWAHLEKKRTRLQTNTKTLEDLCSQSLEMASPAIHDAVTTHQVTASHLS